MNHPQHRPNDDGTETALLIFGAFAGGVVLLHWTAANLAAFDSRVSKANLCA